MNPINLLALKKILDAKVSIYNNPAFIAADPISVPHRFKLKQDIEIAAFFASDSSLIATYSVNIPV